MFLGAHIAVGLIIGKVTGNYPAAFIGALFIDSDHLIPYIKHGVVRSFEKFWKFITNPADPLGEQRNILHNVGVWVLPSIVLLIFYPRFGIPFSLAYGSHLILDALDGSDYYPFYPLKVINLKGPIEYLSKAELIFTTFLFLIFIFLWI